MSTFLSKAEVSTAFTGRTISHVVTHGECEASHGKQSNKCNNQSAGAACMLVTGPEKGPKGHQQTQCVKATDGETLRNFGTVLSERKERSGDR